MRAQAEAEAEALQRTALDGLPHGVVLVGRDGVVRLANQAWRRLDAHDGLLSGVGVGTDLHAALRAVRHGAAADDAGQLLQGIEDLAEHRTDSFRLTYPGRGPAWLRVTGASPDAHGNVVLTREDDTARHRLLRDLGRAAAHERQVERAEGLRTLAGLTSGRRRLDLEPVDLAPHLDAAHEAFRARVGETGRHVTKRVLGPLPALADLRALDRALLELLLNAHAATRPGGTVHLEAQVEGDEVRVCVVDDGGGFDAGALAKRLGSLEVSLDAEERQEGVGLALAQAVMAHHDGDLRLQGDAQGAVAVLAMPVRGAEPPPPKPRSGPGGHGPP